MTESGSAFYPLHDDKDSLYYHTGQEWADMLPCLKHLDLIASDANGKLSVGDRKWEFFTNKHKYELGTFKGKKDTKKSYFVMKRPAIMKDLNFPNPEKQLQAGFVVPQLMASEDSKNLRDCFWNCRVHLLALEMEKEKKRQARNDNQQKIGGGNQSRFPLDS